MSLFCTDRWIFLCQDTLHAAKYRGFFKTVSEKQTQNETQTDGWTTNRDHHNIKFEGSELNGTQANDQEQFSYLYNCNPER